MARDGRPLMQRVLPADAPPVVWDHYPEDDAVDRTSGARWYYHAHPPGERGPGEHGHFHLFLDKRRLSRADRAWGKPPGRSRLRANVTHVAALSVDPAGLPTRIFATNRWVTDEWLYPAAAIMRRLDLYTLDDAPGDPLVNTWLAAAVGLFGPEIHAVLEARDAALSAAISASPDALEDRDLDVLAFADLDLDAAASEALG